MTAVTEHRRTRRIAVIFAGGSSDTGLVRVLGSLLPKTGADITGVFIEDQTLFRLASLPFISEVSRITSKRRPLAVRDLERQLKVQARRAERELQRLAESLGLPWSFRTHRGPLSSALAEAQNVDLLLLGAARRALASAAELHETSRMLQAAEAAWLRPVAVLLDQADSGSRALEAGIELAEASSRPLLVFLADPSPRAWNEVRRRLQSFGPKRAAIHRVREAEREVLAAAIRRASPTVLIVAAGEGGFEELRLTSLRQELRCPVVVVRTEAA
ncbi:MAG: hypothetical protein AMJ62_07475 [Myxococcales bacterium SG8_38]|nr:MAG: hypothetical protein AMJ62_07475 [Myxococcales bacterium SG8_38]